MDENGNWDQSCFHSNLANYTLELWTGYYKSLNGAMYCDGTFGPLMVRKEKMSEMLAFGNPPFTKAERLLTFTGKFHFTLGFSIIPILTFIKRRPARTWEDKRPPDFQNSCKKLFS